MPFREELRRAFQLVARVTLSAGLLFCAYRVAARTVAGWYYRQGTVEALTEAVAWDPSNPRVVAALARGHIATGDEAGAAEAIRLYEQATRLDPRRVSSWLGLASAYEWAGQIAEAEQAFAQARRLAPRTPAVNWQAGNFYLRAGRMREAFAALRQAARTDPELRRPAFDVAWRTEGNAEAIFDELVPHDTAAVLPYLDFLAANPPDARRADAAEAVWKWLVASGAESPPRAVFPYLDMLVQLRRADALEAAWAVLDSRPRPAGDRVVNGSFEAEPWDGGLDWRVHAAEGAGATIVSSTAAEGDRSLEIRFDGQLNADYRHVFQYVVVRPGTAYRFTARVRGHDLSTDSGPRLELVDFDAPDRHAWQLPMVLGTSDWQAQSLDLRTGPATRLLILRVIRAPSRRLDNRIRGTFWLDAVSLRPAG